ncbi:replicative DNA helicase [Fusibacter bizertensis]|uniref:Replicative DNA helicase n=1 Tax=Fusibacter bizertensis TaxID=1488331 RepID=A0ABT6NFL1_9FIRM|nr:replicative DNA helicase [Fusibacter bizertensis]MDH8679220.1 replicative DNA helicase [Fusibacter bizertensis]
MNLKTMPHDINAEQSVIGSLLLDSDLIGDVLDVISQDEEFYHEAHKEIFRTIKRLFSDGQTVDMITVSDELGKNQLLEAVGGFEYLTELSDVGTLISNISNHAKIVHEKYMLRRLIRSSTDIVEKGYDSHDVELLIEEAESSIFEISQNRDKKGFQAISDVLQVTYEKIVQLHEDPNALTGIPTGFDALDEMTNGFQRSDMILIAARPSMGKTAFALNLCQYAAVKEKKSVAIFSLEMAAEQLVQRLLSAQSLVSIGDIRTGHIEDDDWFKLARSSAQLGEAKIFIDDTPGITVAEIRSKCRRLKMNQGLDMIMIDYLQLMSGGGKSENRQQEISTISRSLKSIAREMNCPVIALSQLSRASELRADHRPILSDLRESGAIEQDADLVMFLYRDEYYNPDTVDEKLKGIGEVIIAKQRNGETGKVYLAWLGKYTKFANTSQVR